MTKYTPSKIRALVGFTCLTIATVCSITEGKPVKDIQDESQIDPIMALPSDNQPTQMTYLQPPANTAVTYVQSPSGYPVQYYPDPAIQQQPNVGQSEQPITEVRQEIHYIVRPENQISSEPQTETPGADQKHQYISIGGMDQIISLQPGGGSDGTQQDYPGEILYLGPNGELAQLSGSSQELPQDPARAKMSHLTGMISGSSGLAATILTEVPAKDMPQHVLDKLKREYGIKVVATREYPGANLVINCDEDSSQTTDICAKQLAFTTTSSNAPYSISTTSSNVEHKTLVANEQPNSSEEPNYAIETTGSRTDQETSFGSRNISPASEEYAANTRVEYEAQGNGQRNVQVHQPEKAEGQSDSDSGFDVSPAASTESMDSKNMKRNSRTN